MKFNKILFSFFAIFLLAANSQVLAQNGTIRGTIIDEEYNGDPMIGANVLVSGTQIGTATDLDGKFTINIAPGTYSLELSFIGYTTKTISDVVVKAGEVTVINTSLGIGEAAVLGAVEVSAKMDRNTDASVILMQRKSANTVDGISSSSIKRSGDSDAAGAVKRVTGVSVEGGKYVTVRGLGDRYSKTALNGAEIPSLDPNKNSVQLDLFPTNLIDNMLVYKTFTPDLPGSFTGGYINLATKDFPDKFILQFSTSLGYNTNATFNSNFLTYEGGATDALGFDDGSRDIPAIASGTANNPTLTASDAKSFNRDWNIDTKNPFLNQSYSFSIGNQKKLFGKPFGFIASVSYQKNNSFYENGKVGRYSLLANADDFLTEKRFTETAANQDVLWGVMLNGNLKLNTNNKVGLTVMRNQSATKSARTLQGDVADIGSPESHEFYYQSTGFLERSITTGQVKGEHILPKLRNAKIDWIGSYTLSTQDQPSLRFFSYETTPEVGGGVNYAIDGAQYDVPTDFFRQMEESNADVKVNFSIPYLNWNDETAKLKVGGAYLFKDRDFNEKRFDWRPLTSGVFNGSIDDYFSDANIDNGNVQATNTTETRGSYTGEQTIFGAYAMTELPITKKLKTIFGARFERTDILVISDNPNVDNGTLLNNDVLPSLSFIYALNENMNVRAGYGKTLARPTFRELSPFPSFDFLGDFQLVGNPELERTLIDNIDLRWEWYPGVGDFISASVFYKNFENPIELSDNPQAANREVQFKNTPKALVLGAEFEVRKDLSFVSDRLSNFSLAANVTLIDSEVDIAQDEYDARVQINPNASKTRNLFGQSDWIANATLTYQNDTLGLTTSLSLNAWGKRLAIVSQGLLPDVYEDSRPTLDFTVSKTLSKRWTLGFKARNLLNPEFRKFHDDNGNEVDFSSYKVGRTFSVSIKYNL